MPRVKRGILHQKKRRSLMKAVKGMRSSRSRRVRTAREALNHALDYSYVDRRGNKRNFRRLWIVRINAAAHLNGITYSHLMDGLKKAGVQVNRKMLAEISIHDAAAFQEFVKTAKKHINPVK